ncbi:DUF5776 domain-containing protein [Lentilactobacillus raoultii]|uniref:DUF5776 domain-containing protein n=1 Tax=Lentilactobacillus raoultii TaxID=1987503 RepID=A0ABW3PJR1_9LACO|nr:DUF5776 domain-containing protein [Lentilactobacillus raoultii]
MHKSFNKYLGVFAGVATAGLMVLTIPAQVHGDATGTEVTIKKDSYQKYFATKGLAKYDSTNGTLTFPESVYTGDPASGTIYIDGHPYSTVKHSDGSYYVDLNGYWGRVNPANSKLKFNWINAVGQSYMRDNIDLRKDFSLQMKLKVTPSDVNSPYGQLGDGLSLSFRLNDPRVMGIGGAGLGIGDLKGVFGLVIDNSRVGAPVTKTGKVPTIQLFKSNGTNHDLDGHIYNDTENIKFLGAPKSLSTNEYVGKNLSVKIDWKADSKTLSYEIKDEAGQKMVSDEENYADYLKQQGGQFASFAIAGSNGGTQATDQIQIQKMNYNAVNVIGTNYVLDKSDGSTTYLKPANIQRGDSTEKAIISAYQKSGIDSQTYRLVRIEAPAGVQLDKKMQALPFADSQPVKLPFKDTGQEFTLHYQKVTPEDFQKPIGIKVKRVDEAGKSIGKDLDLSGKFGDTTNKLIAKIDGYEADKPSQSFRYGTLGPDGKQVSEITIKYHHTAQQTSKPNTQPSSGKKTATTPAPATSLTAPIADSASSKTTGSGAKSDSAATLTGSSSAKVSSNDRDKTADSTTPATKSGKSQSTGTASSADKKADPTQSKVKGLKQQESPQAKSLSKGDKDKLAGQKKSDADRTDKGKLADKQSPAKLTANGDQTDHSKKDAKKSEPKSEKPTAATPAKQQVKKPTAVKPITKSASTVKSGQVTHPSTGVSLPAKPAKTSIKTTAPTQKTTSSTNSSSSSSVKTPAVDSGSVQSTRDGLPEGTVRENTEVYAVKGISLYRHADFKKSQRIAHYTKKSRRNWPKFLVTGYARSASGELRYQVKDINRHHKTYGKRGYITADRKFVRPVFYDKKHAKVKVVRLTGITAYHNRELTSKAAHYRYGKVLHVKRLVREHGKTCFVLTNGEYILADRKLVDLK